MSRDIPAYLLGNLAVSPNMWRMFILRMRWDWRIWLICMQISCERISIR